MTDLLTWFTGPPNAHLIGNANPCFTQIEGPDLANMARIIWVKSAQGYPYDIMLADPDYIYLWITETAAAWTDATAYKCFAKPVPLVPRYISFGIPNQPLVSLENPVVTYTKCAATGPSANLGKIKTSVSGPWLIDHGGTLGPQMTLVIAYQWGAQVTEAAYPVREQFYLVEGYGLVRWDTSALDTTTGMYVIGQTSQFNTLTPGGCPAIVNPCASTEAST